MTVQATNYRQSLTVPGGHSRKLLHKGRICLSGLSDDAITTLNLPTAIPFIFEFDADFNPVVSMRFLSDEDTVRTAMEKVASIGKATAKLDKPTCGDGRYLTFNKMNEKL
jgi:hypothetical protein